MRALIDVLQSVSQRVEPAALGIALLKATLILVIARLLVLALPRGSAAMKHLVLTLALCSFPVLPALTVFAPQWSVAVVVEDGSLLASWLGRAPSDSQLEPAPVLADHGASPGLLASSGQLEGRRDPRRDAGSAGQVSGAGQAIASGSRSDVEAGRSYIVTSDMASPGTALSPVAGLSADTRLQSVSTGSSAAFPVPLKPAEAALSWADRLVLVWLAGAALFAGRLATGMARVSWVAHRSVELADDAMLEQLESVRLELGLSHSPRLLLSSYVRVPMVAGLVNAAVVLPPAAVDWSVDRLRVVLLHELAHLKRWDPVTLLINQAISALCWFHPLVGHAERAARQACECACDDLVLNSGARPSDYAAHLLSIARDLPRREQLQTALAIARRSQLESRLRAILNPRVGRRTPSPRAVLVGSALLLLLLTPLAGVRLMASQSPLVSIRTGDSLASAGPDEAPKLTLSAANAPRKGDKNAPAGSSHRRVGPDGVAQPEGPSNQSKNGDADDEGLLASNAFQYAVIRGDKSGLAQAIKLSPRELEQHLAAVAGNAVELRLASLSPEAPKTEIVETAVHAVVDSVTKVITVAKKHHEDRIPSASDGQGWYERGFSLHQEDRYDEAIDAFKKAIDLKYREETAMYNIACGYSLKGNVDEALQWLDRAFASGFDRPDLLAQDSDLDPLRSDKRFQELQAKHLGKSGKHKVKDRREGALEKYESLKAKGSKNGEAWYKVGSNLLRTRDFDQGIDALKRSVELLKYDSSPLYNLACGYALKGDKNAALETLGRAVEAGYDDSSHMKADPDLVSLRGEARFESLLKQADFYSMNRFRKGHWGKTEYSSKQWAPAIEEFGAYVKSHPNDARAWFNLGYALHYSRMHEQAVEGFQKAGELGYRKPTTMYNIACAYAMMNRKDEAFTWLDRAAKAGFEVENYASHDKDLKNLRGDERFKQYLRSGKDWNDDDDDDDEKHDKHRDDHDGDDDE